MDIREQIINNIMEKLRNRVLQEIPVTTTRWEM